MSIQVIGAGMGRTGTLSLKHALEELGYHKTHHMLEVIENPEQLPYWIEMHHNRKSDYDAMFKGFTAMVDFPGAIYYKEFMVQYPDAKVILNVRDPEKWYKSVNDTIYNIPRGFQRVMMKAVGIFKPEVKYMATFFDYVDNLLWNGFFEGKFEDKEFTIKKFNDWIEEVKRTVPPEKLLVFEVSQGWEPLCAFLNKPIPDKPFPRVNDTAEFNERKKKMTKK
ncbi:MAG: sulfotransferase [Chitinophagales bacterium]